ncbi:unnamed protein product [Nippostrongylus brasiliensis]|uniref:Hydroxysteroid dehydrogenase-like protein 2 n=1 Tax=Nippostrongylus brasiliensis TaxID=27835 RepID=A0A158R2Y1_NIPBR|nr:unnamed protein product [Nippostrongylus brasiliensis]
MHWFRKFVGRTVVISGASRGIGKEIALKLAKDGANIVVAAKTASAHPKLPGTIYTAAEEIEKAGGKALPCVVDVRDETSVRNAVEAAVKKFGGIDILINNASAISLTGTEETEMKRYDLMHSINTRGTFLMSKTCLPYLKQGKNPHILNISPPLLMEPRWFSNHVAYTMAKYGMSMCVLGMHEEFRPYGVAVNALWPLTADFFIPNIENYPETFRSSSPRAKSVESLKKAAVEEDVTNVLKSMKTLLSKELVDQIKGVFEFTLTGRLLNSLPRFTLAATDFAPIFTGQITPTNAFMSKKLKIKGDMTMALKLEGLLKKLNKSRKQAADRGSWIERILPYHWKITPSEDCLCGAVVCYQISTPATAALLDRPPLAISILNEATMTDRPATGKGKFFGRTVLITGASRGIGKEIALRLAKDGANIVIAAKTATAHPKLPGTIYTAAEEIEKKFGGIDILINNASAISLTGTEETEMKRYDLMHSINTRGTFLMSKTCLPYLKQGKNPHILNISPPLLMEPRWFSNHVAYTMAKYGMSMCVLAIWTSAMEMLSDGSGASGSRKAEIMVDAAYAILSKNSREYTGNFAIDEDLLRAEGVTDFKKYAIDPDSPLTADFFIPNIENYPETFPLDSPKSAIDADLSSVLSNVNMLLTKETVNKVNGVLEFTLTGNGERKITVDLKHGSGSVTEGGSEKADVRFTLSASDFVRMFTGKITPTSAFMSKKLNIKGDMTMAVKLEALLKKVNTSKL